MMGDDGGMGHGGGHGSMGHGTPMADMKMPKSLKCNTFLPFIRLRCQHDYWWDSSSALSLG